MDNVNEAGMSSVRRSSSMNRKKVETGPNRTEKTEPNRLQFGLFEKENWWKTALNRTDKNRLQPVQNGNRYSL